MRKIMTTGFDHKVIGIAHNHRHGSGNCVQCSGRCQITDPTQAAYTGLIRALLDAEEYSKVQIPYMAERFLLEHGIDLREWRKAERPVGSQATPQEPKS